ncbi:MAG: thiol peroxidase [Woeseiaceae bacterium]|nr:thiol peroxidase [Woeseiaceae bacterium]
MSKIVFDNSTYRTAGELPAVGSAAPDVSLVNTNLANVSLANWIGMRKIMNIFVSIDTDVCATSVKKFEQYGAGHNDVAMLMISYDLPFAHKRFKQENDLESVIGLSAIRHAGFGENYGVEIMDGPLAGMFARAIVVLDENNTVVHQEHIEDITNEPDYAAAFRALGITLEDE